MHDVGLVSRGWTLPASLGDRVGQPLSCTRPRHRRTPRPSCSHPQMIALEESTADQAAIESLRRQWRDQFAWSAGFNPQEFFSSPADAAVMRRPDVRGCGVGGGPARCRCCVSPGAGRAGGGRVAVGLPGSCQLPLLAGHHPHPVPAALATQALKVFMEVMENPAALEKYRDDKDLYGFLQKVLAQVGGGGAKP